MKYQPEDYSNAELLDQEVITSRQSFDKEFFDTLINVFLKEAPLLIDQIKDLHQVEDQTQVLETSHQLKGMCANMGALRLSLLAKNIQFLAQTNQNESIGAEVGQLDNAFDLTRKELEAYLG